MNQNALGWGRGQDVTLIIPYKFNLHPLNDKPIYMSFPK